MRFVFILKWMKLISLNHLKGNPVKSGFMMPTPSRKCGKAVTKRGVSSEQVCVLTYFECQGNIYTELVSKGHMKTML